VSRAHARSVRRELVRIAGSANRRGIYFRCALLAEVERGYVAFARNMQLYLWGDAPPLMRVREVTVPRSLRPYLGRSLRVAA
jgi:hypothetical protein